MRQFVGLLIDQVALSTRTLIFKNIPDKEEFIHYYPANHTDAPVMSIKSSKEGLLPVIKYTTRNSTFYQLAEYGQG